MSSSLEDWHGEKTNMKMNEKHHAFSVRSHVVMQVTPDLTNDFSQNKHKHNSSGPGGAAAAHIGIPLEFRFRTTWCRRNPCGGEAGRSWGRDGSRT